MEHGAPEGQPVESMDSAPVAKVPESPEHASLAEVWDCKLIICHHITLDSQVSAWIDVYPLDSAYSNVIFCCKLPRALS